jgi:hypothetical protein
VKKIPSVCLAVHLVYCVRRENFGTAEIVKIVPSISFQLLAVLGLHVETVQQVHLAFLVVRIVQLAGPVNTGMERVAKVAQPISSLLLDQ